ncbi:MAG: YdcF family protein [Clostridia bacterium]|nr:YdcF family protein [Clostridia bacterium]
MKRFLSMIMALLFVLGCAGAAAEETVDHGAEAMGQLLADLVLAYEQPSDESLSVIEADIGAIPGDADRAVARSIADHWRKVYLDPDYRLLVLGEDDPALLAIPDPAVHAFAVLGYQLKDGEMTDELRGRCDAAAAAARAFPGSIIVCSGGATGPNNPEGHTEADRMRDYLITACGIDAERILTDSQAMSTSENAVNTLAILRGREIRTMTVVTSSYHQRWGQMLFSTAAARSRQTDGYAPEIIGSYCFDIQPGNEMLRMDDRIAVQQMCQMLGLSVDIRRKLPPLQRPSPATEEASAERQ